MLSQTLNARVVLKEAAYGLAHRAGLTLPWRRARRGTLTVLTYHSFGDAAEHPYLHRIPARRFIEQLDYIKRHYEVLPALEGLRRLTSHEAAACGRPMLAITVDDGYSDNWATMFPAVKQAGVPVTVFLATDYLDTGQLPWPTRLSALLHFATAAAVSTPLPIDIGTPTAKQSAGRILRQHLSRLSHAARDEALQHLERELAPRPFVPLAPLQWDQVREMARAGVHFGSHTHFHGWLDRLPCVEIDLELAQARARIEQETAMACPLLAYPNGNWNAAVADAARRAGYAYAFTQDNGANSARLLEPLALKRIEIPFNERIGTFACRVAGLAR